MNATLNRLMSVADANALIQSGKTLLLAGEEAALQQLAKGNWIGGTIPYFMEEAGGCVDKQQVFATDLTDVVAAFAVRQYKASQLETMFEDRYQDGFTYVLVPAFSEVHARYSLEMRYLPHLFDVVTMGWVTGVHLDEIGQKTPKVFNGQTGEALADCLIALHCQLPQGKYADIEIVNVYEQDDQSPVITFPSDSFACTDCTIDGEPANLADYMTAHHIDASLPLIADYSGALINTTIEKVDKENHKVSFLAPMVRNQEYRIARHVEDRYKLFADRLPDDDAPIVCSCNCVVNYMGLGLEGKKTAAYHGPFTFGEIAYILLNQTMVLLSVKDR